MKPTKARKVKRAKLTLLFAGVLALVGTLLVFGSWDFANLDLSLRVKMHGMRADAVEGFHADVQDTYRWTGLCLVIIGAALMIPAARVCIEGDDPPP